MLQREQGIYNPLYSLKLNIQLQTLQCATVLGIDYNPIQSCAEGTEGDELLARLGDRTHNFTPQITFVPTIVINGVSFFLIFVTSS